MEGCLKTVLVSRWGRAGIVRRGVNWGWNQQHFDSGRRLCTHTSPLQNTFSQASTPVPAGFISVTHLGHIFARKKMKWVRTVQGVTISFISTVGGGGEARLSHLGAHLKRCLLSPRRTKLHAWLLPTQGKQVGQTLHEEGRERRVYWQEGRVRGHPHQSTLDPYSWSELLSSPFWKVTWDGQLAFFNPYFFSCVCNLNNSYIHQQSINTIHPDILWLHFQETGEGHSFIFHRDNNARWCLALSKRYNLGVRVCGPECQSIHMDPFPLQTGIKMEVPLLTLVIYIFFLPTHCILGFFSFSKCN